MTTTEDTRLLREIADKMALQELTVKYSRAIDRQDWELLTTLYHEGAVDVHGYDLTLTIPEFIEFVKDQLSYYEVVAHYVAHSVFEVDGDYAEGETYKINYMRWKSPKKEVMTGTRSQDTYERQAGVWKFTKRSVVLDWSSERPVSEDLYAQYVAQRPVGISDETDISYERLKMFPRGGR